MSGKSLLECLARGTPPPRAPYVPLLGRIAHEMGQVPAETFAGDAQLQTRALVETATALGADAITVGMGVPPATGVDVVGRLKPYLAGRGVVGCLAEPDAAAARAYCDAEVQMVFVLGADLARRGKYRTVGNACGFYDVPVILVEPELEDAARVAQDLGLGGAIVAGPTGGEPGIVGGGLDAGATGSTLEPPRLNAFFWSFVGEVPSQMTPEELVALGDHLTF